MIDQYQKLHKKIDQQARRMKKAEQDQSTLMGQTIYIGFLGILFLLPVIVGAYLGLWLDSKAVGYSIFWTISLIMSGVFIGMFNVYFFIRE